VATDVLEDVQATSAVRFFELPSV